MKIKLMAIAAMLVALTGCNSFKVQQIDAAGRLGIYILSAGNPSADPNVSVTAQSVQAGTQVNVGTTIRLEFTDTAAAD